ncbi:MAG: hypothetical protein HYX27_27885 [Acidobacteria bacterium]|nr:hypothetical protein [Acidobacteriota bacterium]
MSLGNDREQRLNQLFTEYGAACPDPEAGASFMPMLWQRIEARRSPVLQWVTMSRRALVGAAALCMVLGLVMTRALTSSQFYQTTYIEALDDNEVPEDLAALHPVAFDSNGGPADQQ